MNVVIYARCSTTSQDLEVQLVPLRATAAARWPEATVVEHVEVASGADDDRPVLAEAIGSLRHGDVLLVAALDRVGRSLQHLLKTVAHIYDDLGAHVVSVREGVIDTTTAAGRLMMNIIGAFAEFERSLISERVQLGMERRRSAGLPIGRPMVDVPMREIIDLIRNDPSMTVSRLARITGVSRRTLTRRINAAGGMAALRGTTLTNTAGIVPADPDE